MMGLMMIVNVMMMVMMMMIFNEKIFIVSDSISSIALYFPDYLSNLHPSIRAYTPIDGAIVDSHYGTSPPTSSSSSSNLAEGI